MVKVYAGHPGKISRAAAAPLAPGAVHPALKGAQVAVIQAPDQLPGSPPQVGQGMGREERIFRHAGYAHTGKVVEFEVESKDYSRNRSASRTRSSSRARCRCTTAA